jgi:hypothetical protein
MVSTTRIALATLAVAALGLLTGNVTPAGAQTGTWANLTNGFPGTGSTANPAIASNVKGPDTALLLTDGSVIMHDICTPSWFRLLPLNTGTFANSYINGQWSATAINDNAALAAMIGTGTVADNYGPLFYASAVLPDGRVIVNGGEAENSTPPRCQTSPTAPDSTKGSLFDPQTNTWTSVPPPTNWTNIGDAQSILLGVNLLTGSYSTANYMLGNCGTCSATNQSAAAIATITPRPGTTVTWTTGTFGKTDVNNEEGWTLLSTGDLLNVVTSPCSASTCAPTAAERFVVAQQTWLPAGNTTTSLVSQNPLQEVGPGVGIGFNMVVWFGSVNAIQLYNPATNPGKWVAQTAFSATPPPATCTLPAGTTGQAVADGPASLLPNGNILVQTSPVPGFNAPSCFWEFNSSVLTPQNTGPAAPTATVNQPQCNSGTANTTNIAAFQGRMLLLPTGQVLWDAGEGVNCTSIYTTTTAGNPNPVMRPPPHILSISNAALTQGTNNFTITGSMFRGVSQGASYGDDAQSATNFPLVMITNNTSGKRCFGRTHDWALYTSLQFDVPPATTPAAGWALVENACDTAGGGASTLVVIVNGLQSNGIPVTVN